MIYDRRTMGRVHRIYWIAGAAPAWAHLVQALLPCFHRETRRIV